jgi:hypothetical protein
MGAVRVVLTPLVNQVPGVGGWVRGGVGLNHLSQEVTCLKGSDGLLRDCTSLCNCIAGGANVQHMVLAKCPAAELLLQPKCVMMSVPQARSLLVTSRIIMYTHMRHAGAVMFTFRKPPRFKYRLDFGKALGGPYIAGELLCVLWGPWWLHRARKQRLCGSGWLRDAGCGVLALNGTLAEYTDVWLLMLDAAHTWGWKHRCAEALPEPHHHERDHQPPGLATAHGGEWWGRYC